MLYMYMSLIEDDNDKNKFEILYKKYRDMMYYKAYDILKDSYLAEDAVHDSFLGIAKIINKIEIDSYKTKALFLTITKNRAIDLYRKRKIRNHVDLEEIDHYKSSSQDDNTLKFLIKALPDIYRDILELKYYHGYTYEEISKLLHINPNTVGVRLYRAKKMLEEELNDKGEQKEDDYD